MDKLRVYDNICKQHRCQHMYQNHNRKSWTISPLGRVNKFSLESDTVKKKDNLCTVPALKSRTTFNNEQGR